MPQIKKIATRQSYGEALAELGAENPNIVVLDADLSGSTKTSVFAKKFPERFINCGIAEGNMAAVKDSFHELFRYVRSGPRVRADPQFDLPAGA